jgi:hypothetical protein
MPTEPPTAAPIRVKVLSPLPARYFLHQLPQGNPVWGECRFSFDADDRDYDWLVVYDDLRSANVHGKRGLQEALACPPRHTLLVTSEPSSIKHYGNAYTRQFGCVLTSQEAWALPHPDRIFSQAGLIWIYGVGAGRVLSFDEMAAQPPTDKTRVVSMVFSPKRQRHTLHHRRFSFMRSLMQAMPELDVYGRGARPLDDKAEALDAYRYHVAIENYFGPHHWTEKLSDAFLGLTLPFYAGCTNVSDYFPAESYIPIDIRDPVGAARIIRQAIQNNEYEKRLPAIMEARRRVLYEHNLFAVLSREIVRRHDPTATAASGNVLYSRHALRKKYPSVALQDLYGKMRSRVIHLVRGHYAD